MSSPNDDYYDGVVSTAKCVNHIDFDSINVAKSESGFLLAFRIICLTLPGFFFMEDLVKSLFEAFLQVFMWKI